MKAEVTNTLAHDIVIQKHIEIGQLQLVKSVTPIEVTEKKQDTKQGIESISLQMNTATHLL